jgi:hypothetical protein
MLFFACTSFVYLLVLIFSFSLWIASRITYSCFFATVNWLNWFFSSHDKIVLIYPNFGLHFRKILGKTSIISLCLVAYLRKLPLNRPTWFPSHQSSFRNNFNLFPTLLL